MVEGVGEGAGDEPPQEEGSEILVPPSTACQKYYSILEFQCRQRQHLILVDILAEKGHLLGLLKFQKPLYVTDFYFFSDVSPH